MRERGGGCIINMGSGHAFACGEKLFAYGCSKGALYVMTKQMARLLAKDRIRVNWITVGWVLTEKELEVQAIEGRDRESLLNAESQRPMGKYNTVEDIAAGCVYLASAEGERVAGAELTIAAGMGIRV
jgi:NAD(P)-dependent dehydrogenase (short-subunit alcohol dehydrogenase family)